MKIQRGIVVALLILGFLFPGRAVCEEKPVFELGIGAALLYLPHYRGSDQSRGFLLPYPYVIYRGDILKVDKEEISGKIFKTDRILLNVSIYGSVPVKSDNCSARAGMPDLDPTFEVGPALDISLLESRENRYNLKFVLPVRAVFSTNFSSVSHEGWVFAPRLNFEKDDIIPQTGLDLEISAGLMFADSSYHAYYYTVDPAYATASRPAYSAGGGYSGSTLTVSLSKTYNQFFFSAFVSADFLQGAVFADSPLVKTNTSIMSGCTVSWVFFKSSKTVATDK